MMITYLGWWVEGSEKIGSTQEIDIIGWLSTVLGFFRETELIGHACVFIYYNIFIYLLLRNWITQ